MIILINTANVKESDKFSFAGIDGRPATIFVEGLGAGEQVDLQFTLDNGTSWNDVYVNDTQIKFTNTSNCKYMNVRGIYRLNKLATAGVVKAVLITDNEQI